MILVFGTTATSDFLIEDVAMSWAGIGSGIASVSDAVVLAPETLRVPSIASETLGVPSHRADSLRVPFVQGETLRC